MTNHLADAVGITSYKVRIEFTDRFEPSTLSSEGFPFVSIEDEIEANSASARGKSLRDEYGRIPYGSPLYLWESETNEGTEVLYVGQTMLLTLQKRFEGHAAVVKLLADHVNRDGTSVFFRLCSRLNLIYQTERGMMRSAIEHFPLNHARKIVGDIEAYIIFQLKPPYNKQHKNKEKAYIVPFSIDTTRNISLR